MPVPFYRYSYKTATSEMMTERYRESKAENIRCVKYIEDENTGFYANAYKDNCVDSDGEYTKHLIEEFGLERVMSIYAATLKASIHDGRISPDMKKWASDFNAGLRHEEDKSDLHLSKMHIGIVNILARHAVEEYNKLKLFSSEHCISTVGEDLTGRVIVVSPKHLKEEYWAPENQLWLATGGFGCSPTASGRAVYSTCLIDGDENRWDRGDIIGIIKDEYLPDWAREKLQEMQNPEQELGMELK